MLIAHIDRYVALRQTLGFTLREVARTLRAFAQFAAAAGDTHVRGATALAWAARGSSPHVRHVRFRDVMRLARFLHAEDPAHEVLPVNPFPAPRGRPVPYIYAPAELAQLVAAAGRLRLTYPLRRPVSRSGGPSSGRAGWSPSTPRPARPSAATSGSGAGWPCRTTTCSSRQGTAGSPRVP
jgi:hypothetical protein